MADAALRQSSAPWLLSLPSLLLFVGLLAVPMALTAVRVTETVSCVCDGARTRA